MRDWIRRLQVLMALLAASTGAQASYHLWQITQLFSNADGSVQYIEMKALAGGQQFLRNHTLVSTQGSTSKTFVFPADLPGDTSTTSDDGYGYYISNPKSMVIGTQGFAALGVLAPDYVVPNGFLSTSGGTLNYAESADTWTYPALPTDGTHALFRGGSTGTNAPQNFMGEGATLALSNVNAPGALSGLWWNAGESGWGVHVTQRRNVLFAAWFTYDGSGAPKWYVASSCTMPAGSTGTTGTCSGSLYEVNGPTFFGTAFNPALDHVVTAGTLQMSFQDANTASMTYTVAGQARTVAITRQPVGSGTTPPAVDYTDLWWNASESGWGLAIAQQFGNMFLAWYVYDGSGNPTWYVASNCAVSGSGCTGTLYRTTGPAFGPAFDGTKVQVFPAGTVTLTFTDPNNGTVGYTVNGISGTKAITRQVF